MYILREVLDDRGGVKIFFSKKRWRHVEYVYHSNIF